MRGVQISSLSCSPLRYITQSNLLHRTVQGIFLLFFIYVGIRFFLYAQWAMGLSPNHISRPASVEAFLPLSALLALKRFLLTGAYDTAHPAGLTILLMAILSALLFRKGFCGHLCPVGTISQWLYRLSKKKWKPKQLPKWLSIALTLPKYALLTAFLYSVLFKMRVSDIESFLQLPFNHIADTKMLLFFYPPSTTTLIVLGTLIAGSIFFPLLWCRCLCPYGALLGITSLLSPVAVQRNAIACTSCQKCTKNCPVSIQVHKKNRVNSPECLGCTECLAACPQPDCLTLEAKIHTKQWKIWPTSTVLGTIIVVYLLFVAANAAGTWENNTPKELIRMYHKMLIQP